MLEGKLQADSNICFVVLQRKTKSGSSFYKTLWSFFMDKGAERGIEKNLKFCFQWMAHKTITLYINTTFFHASYSFFSTFCSLSCLQNSTNLPFSVQCIHAADC